MNEDATETCCKVQKRRNLTLNKTQRVNTYTLPASIHHAAGLQKWLPWLFFHNHALTTAQFWIWNIYGQSTATKTEWSCTLM